MNKSKGTSGSRKVKNSSALTGNQQGNNKTFHVVESEPERIKGHHVLCGEKWYKLVLCKFKKLETVDVINFTGSPGSYTRFSCTIMLESLPPLTQFRFVVYDIWRAKSRTLPSGETILPTWRPPFKMYMESVTDIEGFEWEVERRGTEMLDDDASRTRTLLQLTADEAAYTIEKGDVPAEPDLAVSTVPRLQGKNLSWKQLAARRAGGKSRAVFDAEDERLIFEEYRKRLGGSNKTEIARRIIRWCGNKGIERRDSKPITTGNIKDLIKRKETNRYGSR